MGYVSEAKAIYSKHPIQTPGTRIPIKEISSALVEPDSLVKTSRMLRSEGDFSAPGHLIESLRAILASGKFRILQSRLVTHCI
jgi:hypothetical protein